MLGDLVGRTESGRMEGRSDRRYTDQNGVRVSFRRRTVYPIVVDSTGKTFHPDTDVDRQTLCHFKLTGSTVGFGY